jgi:hypothetical protein
LADAQLAAALLSAERNNVVTQTVRATNAEQQADELVSLM